MKNTVFFWLSVLLLSGCSSWQYAGFVSNHINVSSQPTQRYRIRRVHFSPLPTADLLKASQIPGVERAIECRYPSLFTRNVGEGVPIDVSVRVDGVSKEGFWTDIPKFMTFCIIPSVKHTNFDVTVEISVLDGNPNGKLATFEEKCALSIDSRYSNLPWGLVSFDRPKNPVSLRDPSYVALGFAYTWHDARIKRQSEVLHETVGFAVKNALIKYENMGIRKEKRNAAVLNKVPAKIIEQNSTVLEKKELDKLKAAGLLSESEYAAELKKVEVKK